FVPQHHAAIADRFHGSSTHHVADEADHFHAILLRGTQSAHAQQGVAGADAVDDASGHRRNDKKSMSALIGPAAVAAARDQHAVATHAFPDFGNQQSSVFGPIAGFQSQLFF